SPSYEKILKHEGFEPEEPLLLFAGDSTGGKPVRDEHPMRGIIRNGPYDFALTRVALADRVSVGVVCPKADARRFHDYLGQIVRPQAEPRGGQEYLLDFPGFQAAFRVPIHLPPHPLGSGWENCPDPASGRDNYATGIELGQQIVALIDNLQAASSP